VTRALRVLLAGCCALLVLGGGFVCRRVAERGRFTSAFSSYGAGPDGTRGLFLLAEAQNARPMRWVEDLAALPDEGGMLVALGDCESGMARSLSRFEQHELEQWIAGGGVLLVAGARHYLPEDLGVAFEPSLECAELTPLLGAGGKRDPERKGEGSPAAEPNEAAPALPDSGSAEPVFGLEDPELVWTSPIGDPLRGLPPIAMHKPGRLVLDDDADGARVLLTMPDAPNMSDSNVQREAAVVVGHGRGHVIALASASMLQNRALALGDGGVLFARLLAAYAPAGPVLFDEYHLGVGERRSMMRYLRQAGVTPFALQLLLAALLALWRSGARFGAVRRKVPPAPAGTASFVSALGGLFARSRDPLGVLRILEHQALAHVAARHHLPFSSASRLARALADRGLPGAANAVLRLTESERVLMAEKLDLIAVSKRIDAAVAEACAVLPAAAPQAARAARIEPADDGELV
jgi:hypothetical protein